MTDDSSDTEPSPAPDEAEMLDAIAHDLEVLAGAARGIGDDADQLVARLRAQAGELRGKS
jgi:hypothetical protein